MDNSITINNYISDNSEVIDSSQNTIVKVKKKKNTTSTRSTTKLNINLDDSSFKSVDTSDRNFSLSDIVTEKEELSEILNNFNGCDSIDMTHDLTGLIIDYESVNLEDSLIASHSNNILSIKNEPMEEEIQDPLYIHEKDKIEFDNMCTKNTKKKQSFSKLQENTEEICNTPYKFSSIIKSKEVKSNKSQLSDQQCNEYLSDKLFKKLETLNVILQHNVPPQHNIENLAGTRVLKKQQVVQFKTYGPLKKGFFTEKEDLIIKRNWIEFCKIHNWNKNLVEPFLYMRHNGKYYIHSLTERKKFVQFLANGLPWRSLYSVYQRFKNLYNCTEHGKYSPKEDRIIISYIKKNSESKMINVCADLAKILKRKRHSIWQHYQNLKKNKDFKNSESDSDSDIDNKLTEKTNKKEDTNHTTSLSKSFDPKSALSKENVNNEVCSKIKWTSPMVKQFIDTLLTVTNCGKLNKLKNQNINPLVWKKMEKQIRIDKKILKKFWYLQLHMQLFCSAPVYLNDLKINLIEYLYEQNLGSLKDISWETVCLNFDGVTKLFLSELFQRLIQYAKIKTKLCRLEDNLDYLYEHHIPELEEKTVDILLPKLNYERGIILCLDKGTETKIKDRFIIDPINEPDDY